MNPYVHNTSVGTVLWALG